MNIFRATTLTVAILLSQTIAYASYESGVSAYKEGNYESALKEFKACPQDVSCQNALGVLYSRGHGVSKDSKQAVKLFTLAANQGLDKAQFNLAFMYFEGEGVPKDYKEAVKLYRLSAGQGYADAQHRLGYLHYVGQGVPLDYKESARWYRLSAEQGYADSQNSLGYLYAVGQGVPQNYKEAIKWYRLGAEQQNSGAQNNLSIMYFNGTGVTQNLVVSYALANLAAANGETRAVGTREKALKQLSSSDISVAQQLTSEMSQSGKVTTVIDRYLRTGK